MLTASTIIPDLQVPNLDCLSAGDLADTIDLFKALTAYAEDVQRAAQHRLDGEIEAARRIDRTLEARYGALPEAYRW